MLTYDALVAEAKIRNMPHTKIRGILREYLQVLILKEIYRLDAGRKLYFIRGTYLRLVHGLKRFSEDLDFNTVEIDKPGFENLLTAVKRELARTGLAANLKFNHFGSVYSSKLIFPEIEKNLPITTSAVELFHRGGGSLLGQKSDISCIHLTIAKYQCKLYFI